MSDKGGTALSAATFDNLCIQAGAYKDKVVNILNDLIDNCKKLGDEDTGIMTGGAGDELRAAVQTLSQGVDNLVNNTANIVSILDHHLNLTLRANQTDTSEVNDAAKKNAAKLGTLKGKG